MAEPIEMSLGFWTQAGPRKHIWGAQWRHLANTTEPSMCGGDAVFLSIKLVWPVVVIIYVHRCGLLLPTE